MDASPDIHQELETLHRRVAELEREKAAYQQSARTLSESEQNLRGFFDTIDHLLFVLDTNGDILLVNAAVTRTLGFSQEELIGQNVLMVHPPERRAEAGRIVGEMLAGTADYCPVPVITREGQQIPVETRVVPGRWSGQPVIFGVTKDLSAIKASEEKFSKAFHASPMPMAISEVETARYMDVNEAFLQTLGFTRKQVLGKTTDELRMFENPGQREALLEQMKRDGRLQNVEVNVRAHNGEIHYGVFFAEYIHLQDQRYLLTVMNDVTNQKRMQAALQAADERWQFALESAGHGVWDWNAQTDEVFFSVQWKKMLGYAEDEIAPSLEEWSSRVHPEDLEATLEKIQQHFRGETPVYTSEHRLRCKDGSYKWILDCGKVVAWTPAHQPARVIGTHTDINQRKEAEEAQRQSEIRYRALFEQAHDAVFILDLEGRHQHVNQRGVDLLGYSIEELQRLSVRETSAEWDESRKMVARLLSGETIPIYERRFRRKDGQVIPTEINVELVCDKYGAPLHIQSVVRDISERKRAEEREIQRREMMKKVIELGKAVTKITDLRECLREIHQSVQKGLGFDRVGLFLYDEKSRQLHGTFGTSVTGQIEDSSWFMQSVDEYQEWQDALRQPGGMSLIDGHETLHGTPAGDEMSGVKQHVTLAAWAGEKPVALIAADNLVSQRKFTAEQLEALQLFAGYAGLAIANAYWNAQLEQRVNERTMELEAANRELESLAYTIAHDLRIPARAMHGFASMLKETQAENLDDEALRQLDQIRANASRMGRQVDDLLEFMHLGQARLTIVPVDMNEVVWSVRIALGKQTAGREVQIQAQDLPACQGDRRLLKLVWSNLLSNALKFTRPRPVAQIEIGAQEVDGQIQYYIRDNGVGFNMKFVGKLFGAFQRLHHPDEFEGTGMGLAIIQRIIHRHKGNVWAEAEENKGATFYFTLG